MTDLVEVAVPLPLAKPLVYRVPPAFRSLAAPGSRARVPVGRRRLVGVILGALADAPAGLRVKSLEAVLDREPVLPEDLLRLAAETARYYIAPIGEVVRSMLPSDLPPWGDQRVRLSDAGALTLGRTADERAVIGWLRESGRLRICDLVESGELTDPHATLEALRRDGLVVLTDSPRRGGRYLAAVELASGSLEELLERCGRSKPGRQAVELLAAMGRPMTVSELCDAVGCGKAVVRRLVARRALRQFTQIARLELDRHLLAPRDAPRITLRADQETALKTIENALEEGAYRAFLLTGMTGSGKTEVYLRAIERVLAADGSAIVLVPEIALVPAVAGDARQRFGDITAILHSGLSGSERRQEWERIRQGQARIVLGPRSAIYSPVRNLRLVVVDEEQDPSYKQDQVPRYNGRDVAILRAHQAGAIAVLVSATPSLETRYNVEVGKASSLTLTHRVGHGELPEGVVVDLRAEAPARRPGEICFSQRLRDEIENCLGAGDQVILLRNRRGYAPMLLCRACGDDSRCRGCGLPRTYHRREKRLRCHYCGSSAPVPVSCARCSEAALEAVGAGTERVEEQVRELWSGVRVDVLDRDTSRRGEAAAVLARFGRGESRILVGTQMVSKGHHFPGVALTAVLLADSYLSFPDFRAVEKTYSLLTQLAGRAGRGERPGRVVIQTYYPEHYAIQAALRHDDARFADEETRFRRIFHYPPYTRMVQILLRDRHRGRAERAVGDLSERIGRHALAAGVRISGPAPAPYERLRGKWRFQMLLRHASGQRLRELVEDVVPKSTTGDLIVDVDPYELL